MAAAAESRQWQDGVKRGELQFGGSSGTGVHIPVRAPGTNFELS